MKALRFTLLLLLLAGCGSSAIHEPESAAPTTGDERTEAAEAAPSEPVAVYGNEYDCALRSASGGMTAECERGALVCSETVRGDLTEHPGDEVLYRCNGPDGRYAQVLALAAANTIVWTLPVTHLDDMCVVGEVSASLVDADDDPLRELLVQIRGCSEPGEVTDADILFKWHDDELRVAAEQRLHCTYMGDTSDPDDVPPVDAFYNCTGGYLRVVTGADGPQVARDLVEELNVGEDREVDDAATRSLLRWDASTGRFVDRAPAP